MPASAPVIAAKIAAMEEKIAALTAIRDRLNVFLGHVNGKTSGDHPGPRTRRITDRRQLPGS